MITPLCIKGARRDEHTPTSRDFGKYHGKPAGNLSLLQASLLLGWPISRLESAVKNHELIAPGRGLHRYITARNLLIFGREVLPETDFAGFRKRLAQYVENRR